MNKIITKLNQYKLRDLSVKSVILQASLASTKAQALEPSHGYERLALHVASSDSESDIFKKE